MYDNLWNDVIINFARGHSFDQNMERLVCNPFPKTFNPGEPRGFLFPEDQTVNYAVKVNGFMLAATMHDGELYVSTTGTTTSDFAKLGRSWLQKSGCANIIEEDGGQHTYIYEVCDQTDPHIVTELPGIYLIGKRANSIEDNRFNLIQFSPFGRFGDVQKEVDFVTHEGFMCWTENKCVKLKSPFYQVLKKIARSNTLDKMVSNAKKSQASHAGHPVFSKAENYDFNWNDLFELDEQSRLALLRQHFQKLLEVAKQKESF